MRSFASTLERVPASSELHVHLVDLDYIDHACFDLLLNWEKQHENTGGRLSIDWNDLQARFRTEAARRAEQAKRSAAVA